MAAVLPIPSTGEPVFDPNTGLMTEVWRRYFLSIENLAPDVPPIDAKYWVSTSNSELTDETNIGALTPSGFLKVTIAAGVAVPTTVASIPGADVTGAALTKTDDTNVTLTLGGTPATALLRAASLTLGWSGTLGLSRGGTNANLSATGGASQVLRQSTVGGNVTVSQLATTDINGLASGTYTPTLTNVANLDGSTAHVCQYQRNGSVVTVSGTVDVDPTTIATSTTLGISLPIASNFGSSDQCGGTSVAPGVQSECASISADAANDRASMVWITGNTANTAMRFIFQYVVV